jgi:hypothetical protein
MKMEFEQLTWCLIALTYSFLFLVLFVCVVTVPWRIWPGCTVRWPFCTTATTRFGRRGSSR